MSLVKDRLFKLTEQAVTIVRWKMVIKMGFQWQKLDFFFFFSPQGNTSHSLMYSSFFIHLSEIMKTYSSVQFHWDFQFFCLGIFRADRFCKTFASGLKAELLTAFRWQQKHQDLLKKQYCRENLGTKQILLIFQDEA